MALFCVDCILDEMVNSAKSAGPFAASLSPSFAVTFVILFSILKALFKITFACYHIIFFGVTRKVIFGFSKLSILSQRYVSLCFGCVNPCRSIHHLTDQGGIALTEMIVISDSRYLFSTSSPAVSNPGL